MQRYLKNILYLYNTIIEYVTINNQVSMSLTLIKIVKFNIIRYY